MRYETGCIQLFYQEPTIGAGVDYEVCRMCRELAKSLGGTQPSEIEKILEQIRRLNPVNVPLTPKNSKLAADITNICIAGKTKIREHLT